MIRLALICLCIVSCAPLISEGQHRQLAEQFLHRTVVGCPTSEPLAHHVQARRIVSEYTQHKNLNRMGRELVDACPGLTAEQRQGYLQLINAAYVQFQNDYAALANGEYRRRVQMVQHSGQVIQDIDRNERLRNIEHNTKYGW